jgi:hypothetical protein
MQQSESFLLAQEYRPASGRANSTRRMVDFLTHIPKLAAMIGSVTMAALIHHTTTLEGYAGAMAR